MPSKKKSKTKTPRSLEELAQTIVDPNKIPRLELESNALDMLEANKETYILREKLPYNCYNSEYFPNSLLIVEPLIDKKGDEALIKKVKIFQRLTDHLLETQNAMDSLEPYTSKAGYANVALWLETVSINIRNSDHKIFFLYRIYKVP